MQVSISDKESKDNTATNYKEISTDSTKKPSKKYD